LESSFHGSQWARVRHDLVPTMRRLTMARINRPRMGLEKMAGGEWDEVWLFILLAAIERRHASCYAIGYAQ
jgi:hypothetical protein